MLDRAHRLTDGRLFATTIRRGRRAGSATLVLHLAAEQLPPERGPQVGLVVGRTVGNAVTRSQVKRRLRHQVRDRLRSLPDRSVLVIRALPPAATATSAVLGADLDSALRRVLSRTEAGARPAGTASGPS